VRGWLLTAQVKSSERQVFNEQHTCNMPVQLVTVKLQTYDKHVIVRWQYGLDDLEFDFLQGQEDLSSPQCADWLSGPPSLLFNKYSSFLSPRYSNWAVQLTARFHLMPRLITNSAIPLLPLHAFVPCTGTTSPLHNAYKAVKCKQQIITTS